MDYGSCACCRSRRRPCYYKETLFLSRCRPRLGLCLEVSVKGCLDLRPQWGPWFVPRTDKCQKQGDPDRLKALRLSFSVRTSPLVRLIEAALLRLDGRTTRGLYYLRDQPPQHSGIRLGALSHTRFLTPLFRVFYDYRIRSIYSTYCRTCDFGLKIMPVTSGPSPTGSPTKPLNTASSDHASQRYSPGMSNARLRVTTLRPDWEQLKLQSGSSPR